MTLISMGKGKDLSNNTIEMYVYHKEGEATAEVIQIPRNNTLINGYSFGKSEINGSLDLLEGISNLVLGILGPYRNPLADSDELLEYKKHTLKGCALFKDSMINLSLSPLTIATFAICTFSRLKK